MKITLKALWFAPDGNRRRPGDHSIPDAWEKHVPKSAVVLAPPKLAAPKPAEPIEPVEPPAPVEPERKTLTVKK
jgi:hypothetical protein